MGFMFEFAWITNSDIVNYLPYNIQYLKAVEQCSHIIRWKQRCYISISIRLSFMQMGSLHWISVDSIFQSKFDLIPDRKLIRLPILQIETFLLQ